VAESGKPLFWKAFDAAERAVGPRLEDAARSGPFLDALGLAARAQARARRDLERSSRRVWHLINLPAGSDVTRLRRQVADLDRELRRVNAALERAVEAREDQSEEEDEDADVARGAERRPARARRAAGPRSPGRRAQRAESP
jgi:hypothetical protein